jgi:hypothetical protein
MTSPDSPPPNILGEKPRGFTDPQKQAALEIKARILAGETIPLAELQAFILSADADLSTTRAKKNTVEKRSDVDFF